MMGRRLQWLLRLRLAWAGRFWKAHPQPGQVKRIMVIEMTRLGDVVAASSMIDPLLSAYPGATLEFVASSDYAPLFEGDARLRFIGLPSGGWSFVAAARAMRERLRDPGLALIVASPAIRNSMLVYHAKPGLAAGFLFPEAGGLSYDQEQPLYFRRGTERRQDVSGRSDHLVERSGRVLKLAGLETQGMEPGLVSSVARDPRLVVLHAGANWAWRRWPMENFVRLESELKAAGWKTRLLGPEEKIGLRDLRDLLASAALFIGNDSGPLHLAASLDTPCVGLFGPNLPSRSGPWPLDRHLTLREEVPCCPCAQTVCVQPWDWCMQKLSVARVLGAVNAALSKNPYNGPSGP